MPKIKANKAFVIARVSTEEQAKDDRKSIPAQLQRILDYAEKNNLIVVGKEKIIESAYKPNRPKFMEALMKVVKIAEESDESIAVLLYEVDRFSRDVSSQIKVKADELRNRGKIELHFVYDDLVIHKSSRQREIVRWEEDILHAKKESAIKSDKVKDAIKFKLKRGEFPGWACTGYLNDTEKKTVYPDPERKDGIMKMFKLYSTGNYSAEEIAKILRADGFTMKPSKGRKPRLIGKGDVVSLLNKRFYTGFFEWTDPETGEMAVWKGNYKPLISAGLFEKVKKVLSKRAVRYATSHTSSTKFFKYRGLLECSFCECGMTPNDVSKNFGKPPGTEVRYRCTYGKKNTQPDYYEDKFGTDHSGITVRKKKLAGGKFSEKKETHINCPQLYWTEKEIDEAIKEKLQALSYDKGVLKSIKEKLSVDFESRMTASELNKKGLEAEMNRLKNIKSGLIRKLALEEFTQNAMDFQNELEKLNEEIEAIKLQIEALEEAEQINVNELADVLTLCSDLYKQFDSLQPKDQRHLVMTAFKRISVRKGRIKDMNFNSIDIAWSEPFEILHEKWFKEAWEKDKKKGGPWMMGGNTSVNKMDCRESDEVGR